MQQYLKSFAIDYGVVLILSVLFLLFVANLGLMLFVAIFLVTMIRHVIKFLQKEQRLPTAQERNILVWGNTAIAITLECFIIFFLVMMNPNAEQIIQSAEKMGLAGYAVFMLLIVAIHFALFFIAYQWMSLLFLKLKSRK
ncbi:ABZJ_00895 family protein [Acinetobacter sp. SA01]|uniref:ABZJ_00895 family protein n=1 Tax=Acinetobacter sp. SA01 TaxID=1862567 RepID=UPI00140C1FD8|nr:ABZJ_00895 family protein [Acinetobacter sp. SA01]